MFCTVLFRFPKINLTNWFNLITVTLARSKVIVALQIQEFLLNSSGNTKTYIVEASTLESPLV